MNIINLKRVIILLFTLLNLDLAPILNLVIHPFYIFAFIIFSFIIALSKFHIFVKSK